jgi:two-component system, OmpR family, response regulator
MISGKKKILLVEDDVNFGSILKSYLELHEFNVELKQDGSMGLTAFKSRNFDLCVLDVMMPEMDGFSLAQAIRDTGSPVPFIFLTAKMLKEDQLKGFKLGAEDYITKPFDSEVLLYKIRAILRRGSKSLEQGRQMELQFGKLTFNHLHRKLKTPIAEYSLTGKETELLRMLCLSHEYFLHRKEALLKIWGDENYFTARSMDVYIAKLRKYLKDDPDIEIQNVHGDGYRLVVKRQER